MDTTGYTPEEPIAAIATALAPAALGIVRTSGNGCIALIAPLFSRPDALRSAPGNTLVYGWITDGDRRIDEGMLLVNRAPKSFTGEDMAEISCHRGVSVVSAVYNLLLAHGFRAAEHGE
ncbi:MAG: tRNA uridine-5-carboxymethylaminomethyl(34) synthesis GTPase MnmE, partial [Treponemataceae bacterium]|nr:tRNA uridine-5-carboxymethylaminomethyl(34) synthesis GTPase MnmE [Treponemataceae bacterium]